MTPRERVEAALTFSRPDRVPRDLWSLPYVGMFCSEQFNQVLDRFPFDFQYVQFSAGPGSGTPADLTKTGSYTDEWGKSNPKENVEAVFEAWL